MPKAFKFRRRRKDQTAPNSETDPSGGDTLHPFYIGLLCYFCGMATILLLQHSFSSPNTASSSDLVEQMSPPSQMSDSPSSSESPVMTTESTTPSASLPPALPPLLPFSFSPIPVALPGEVVRWAIVVQGPIYPQAMTSWGNTMLDTVWPGARDTLVRVLSSMDDVPPDQVAQYKAEGFVPVLSSWADFQSAGHTNGGGGNVNLQMHTSYNGLLKARELGATHAIKQRADVRITNGRVFIEQVIGTPHSLSFLTKWVGSPRYPLDYLVAGPIEDVLLYFGPPYKNEATDGRFPELYLMESYSEKRGWTAEDGPTHIKFCREVDFFYPRLPKGLFYFDHKGLNADSDMAGPITPYDVSQGDLCLLGRTRALRRANSNTQLFSFLTRIFSRYFGYDSESKD